MIRFQRFVVFVGADVGKHRNFHLFCSDNFDLELLGDQTLWPDRPASLAGYYSKKDGPYVIVGFSILGNIVIVYKTVSLVFFINKSQLTTDEIASAAGSDSDDKGDKICCRRTKLSGEGAMMALKHNKEVIRTDEHLTHFLGTKPIVLFYNTYTNLSTQNTIQVKF